MQTRVYCKACHFNEQGSCRRHAPVLFQRNGRARTTFPQVYNELWCGDGILKGTTFSIKDVQTVSEPLSNDSVEKVSKASQTEVPPPPAPPVKRPLTKADIRSGREFVC